MAVSTEARKPRTSTMSSSAAVSFFLPFRSAALSAAVSAAASACAVPPLCASAGATGSAAIAPKLMQKPAEASARNSLLRLYTFIIAPSQWYANVFIPGNATCARGLNSMRHHRLASTCGQW